MPKIQKWWGRTHKWWNAAWEVNAVFGQLISVVGSALINVVIDAFVLQRRSNPDLVKDLALATILATFFLAARSISKRKESLPGKILTFGGASEFGSILAMMIVPEILGTAGDQEQYFLTSCTLWALGGALAIGIAYWRISAMSRIFQSDKANQLGHFPQAVEVVLLGLVSLKEHDLADDLIVALSLNQYEKVLKKGEESLFSQIEAVLKAVEDSSWDATLQQAREDIACWPDRLAAESDDSDKRQTRTRATAFQHRT